MATETELSMLRELMDREAIRDCLFRYCRAVDRGDYTLLETVYWPDANDFHGAFNGPASDFIKHVTEFNKSQDLLQHNLGNITIELDGDTAKVESYFTGYQRYKNADGKLSELLMGGRYLDRMEKRGSEWRTADRFVVYDWLREFEGAFDFSGKLFNFTLPTGHRDDAKDPLYSWLGVSRLDGIAAPAGTA